MVFGCDDAVCGAAFARDVAGKRNVLGRMRAWDGRGEGVQVDKLAAFVLHGCGRVWVRFEG